jgi:hypothetical protein
VTNVRYEDISPTMRRWVGGREAFRKMGFSADDLYCLVSKSARFGGVLSAFVHLQAQGKQFDLECGPVASEEAFSAEYKRVAEAINSGSIPSADLDRIWQESEPYQDKVGFATAVTMKGFVAPKSLS